MKNYLPMGPLAAWLSAALVMAGCDPGPTQPVEMTTPSPLAGKMSASHSLQFVDPVDPSDPSIRIFSDGNGEYIDGEGGTHLSVERQFIFRPDDSGRKPVGFPRRLCLRVTADQEVTGAGIPPDLADDLDSTGRTCARGDLRTTWHSNADLGLEAMALNESIRAEARYIWTDGENNQFKLEFFCRDDPGGDDGVTGCGSLLDIALIEETGTRRTWRITIDPAATTVLSRNFVKSKGGGPNPFEVLAAFHMPFALSVTRDG